MTEQVSYCIEGLRKELAHISPESGRSAGPGLYSLTLPLQFDHIPVLGELPPPSLVWSRPDRQHYRVGLGTALQLKTGGPDRFQRLQHCYERIIDQWHHDAGADTTSRPGAFCAFAFDSEDPMSGPWQGLANSLISVPEVLLEFCEGHYTLSLSCQTGQLQHLATQKASWLQRTRQLLTSLCEATVPDDEENTLSHAIGEPSSSEWLRIVRAALASIQAESLDKVVPARHVRVRGTRAFHAGSILRRLAHHYPGCLLLGVSQGNRSLVAATPERLVALHNGTINCDALGGTGEASGDPVRDNLLAHRLLQDQKTRHEHALVVEHLRQALGRVSAHVSVPDTPAVLPLGHLQHLWTPIKAQCRPGTTLLDLAALLHPTPAVSGTPVTAARAWLAAHEPFQRGWYTGGIGWLQADGNGELAVLLRCALLSGSEADLYAGAGIVADSDPKAELHETELKLNAVKRALAKEQTTVCDQKMAHR
jgi:isochorismate synthase